jgi:hypothetical protein
LAFGGFTTDYGRNAKIIILRDKRSVVGKNDKLDVSGILAGAAQALGGGVLGSAADTLSGALSSVKDTLNVHYNPSSIRFDASADSTVAKLLENHMDSSIPSSQKREASIVMSVDLIFDAVNNLDAFHEDKFKIAPSNFISAGAAIATNVFGDGYSVLKETQGLVALMTDNETRRVAFAWSEMCFTGFVQQVQAKYTMFSPSGKPIRSKVALSLMQLLDDSGAKDWDSKFDKFFGAMDSAADIRGKSYFQEMQKFINIGF